MTSTVGQFTIGPAVRKLKRISKEAQHQMTGALFASGLKIEENAKLSIQQGTKTGREYQRGTITHRASAPGEAPASDTGRLVNSFYVQQEKDGKQVRIAAGRGVVDYALMLEKGTRDMAARPFMRPALQKSLTYIRSRIKRALKKAVKLNGK
jgi:HK97 gp10 family phage protein